MFLKKIIAAIICCTTAISAIATSVSAENELLYTADQESIHKEWNFTGKSYPVTWTGEAIAKISTDNKFADKEGKVYFKFREEIESAKLIVEGVANQNATKKTITLKKLDEYNYQLEIVNGLSTITAGKIPMNYFEGAVVISLVYTVKETFSTKASAEDAADKSKDVTVTIQQENSINDFNNFNNSTITAASGEVGDASVTHGPIFYPGEYKWNDNFEIVLENKFSNKLNSTKKTFEELKLGNLLVAIQTEIGDAKNAKLIFNLNVDEEDDEDGADSILIDDIVELAGGTSAQNFGMALNYSASRQFQCATKVADNQTAIEIEWDKLKSGLAAGTIFQMMIKITGDKGFQVDSIVLDAPAMTLKEIAAGEGATETSETLLTDATAETSKTSNPVTGNSPSALAFIPLAVAAGYIILNKKKK